MRSLPAGQPAADRTPQQAQQDDPGHDDQQPGDEARRLSSLKTSLGIKPERQGSSTASTHQDERNENTVRVAL